MSNKTIFLRWIGTVLVMMLASACMQDLFDARKGKVAISVKWPTKSSYSVLAIPEGTERIEVTIQGEGIPDGTPLKAPPLTPNGGEETDAEFIEVPIGPKVIQAIAFGPKNLMLAQGFTTINVKPNALTEARVLLQGEEIKIPITQTTPDPNVTPSPTPTPSAPVTSEYTIETLAGSGLEGAVDATDPKAARFKFPAAIAYDEKRQALYVADTENRLIRRYDLGSGVVATVAGTPASDTAPSPRATSAPALQGSAIGTPAGLAVGPDGALYFSDRDNHVIRKLSTDGSIVIVAGSGKAGQVDSTDATEASFHYPGALTFDANGTLYVADYLNHKIRRVSRLGTVTTLAGTGVEASNGDGGPAGEAALQFPTALTIDPAGEYMYVAESKNARVRRIQLSSGQIHTVLGTAPATAEAGAEPGLLLPMALAFTPTGELLIAEGWALKQGPDVKLGVTSRILKVTAEGKLVRIAGQRNKAYGFKGDGGAAASAELNNPAGLAVDGRGRVIVTDSYNNRLRVLVKLPMAVPPVVAASSAPVLMEEPSPAPSVAP